MLIDDVSRTEVMQEAAKANLIAPTLKDAMRIFVDSARLLEATHLEDDTLEAIIT